MHARVEGLLKDRDRHAAAHLALEEQLRELKRSDEVLRARIAELEREIVVLRAVRPAPAVNGAAEDRPLLVAALTRTTSDGGELLAAAALLAIDRRTAVVTPTSEQ